MREFDERFFHDDDTKDAIAQVAAADKLVIYAGAGVTIDRTRLSWGDLIVGLLARPGLDVTAAEAAHILRMHTPQAAASLVMERYREVYPDPEVTLEGELRQLLYPNVPVPLYARLSSSIAKLIGEWALSGRTVVLVTPNYEDVLLGELQQTHIPVDVLFVGRDKIADVWKTAGAKYVYLHGELPRLAAPIVRPILVEDDYYKNESAIRDAIVALFGSATVLLVGTSMRDNPLNAALLATRTTLGSNPRSCLVPTQGPEWRLEQPKKLRPPLEAHEVRARLAWQHQLRLRHLDVRGVYPDYYSQVAQFIDEVRECHAVGVPYSDPRFPSSYGTRLLDWWTRWYAANSTPADQEDQHRALVQLLEGRLRQILNASKKEALKVELWVRWQPATSRSLRLWASSQGTFADARSMREELLERNSDFIAVNVFCDGKAMMPATVTSGRWPTYVGVPLYFKSGNADVTVPVGSAVLASQASGGSSSISESNGAALAVALRQLAVGALTLLTPP